MGQIKQLARRHFSGAEADIASLTTPFVGDKYFATDTGRSFFYTGSAWNAMIVEGAIDHTWEGDDANNREIDLGDDYDFIFIFIEESKTNVVDHPFLGHAFKTCYGLSWNDGAANNVKHVSMAAANAYFQGKMFGGDSTKIKLGTTGNDADGLNKLNETYRLIGFKFQTMI